MLFIITINALKNILIIFFCLECVSNLSSFLTTVSSAINVFIYFVKHKQFVMSLVFPHHDSISVPATNNRSQENEILIFNLSILRRFSTVELHTILPSSETNNNTTIALLNRVLGDLV